SGANATAMNINTHAIRKRIASNFKALNSSLIKVVSMNYLKYLKRALRDRHNVRGLQRVIRPQPSFINQVVEIDGKHLHFAVQRSVQLGAVARGELVDAT